MFVSLAIPTTNNTSKHYGLSVPAKSNIFADTLLSVRTLSCYFLTFWNIIYFCDSICMAERSEVCML